MRSYAEIVIGQLMNCSGTFDTAKVFFYRSNIYNILRPYLSCPCLILIILSINYLSVIIILSFRPVPVCPVWPVGKGAMLPGHSVHANHAPCGRTALPRGVNAKMPVHASAQAKVVVCSGKPRAVLSGDGGAKERLDVRWQCPAPQNGGSTAPR